MSRPEMLYSISLAGDITRMPVKPEYHLISVGQGLWIYTQNDGTHHELWDSKIAAMKSARRDLKRLITFLTTLHKKLTIEVKEFAQEVQNEND